MQVTGTHFTVAEYCDQFRQGQIIVNRDYQRSPKVWPTAARSYLIDTILLGYPMPKLTLYQITDLATRRTVKEIVDGQQRSEAIYQYLNGRYRLSSRSPNAGKRFNQLDDEDKRRFLDYALSVDLLVAATPDEIRQLFRRINSYTVPLNRQETRHATYQGEFKWFVAAMMERYSPALKTMGVFGEAQLARMADGELMSEIILATLKGIRTASPALITGLYEDYEREFPPAGEIEERLEGVFGNLMRWESLHGSELMKPLHFYTLALAISHCLQPADALQSSFPLAVPVSIDDDLALLNLGRLAEIAELPELSADGTEERQSPELAETAESNARFAAFREAGAEGTNTETNRKTRFEWFCRALLPERL
jgi:hypothetical protein